MRAGRKKWQGERKEASISNDFADRSEAVDQSHGVEFPLLKIDREPIAVPPVGVFRGQVAGMKPVLDLLPVAHEPGTVKVDHQCAPLQLAPCLGCPLVRMARLREKRSPETIQCLPASQCGEAPEQEGNDGEWAVTHQEREVTIRNGRRMSRKSGQRAGDPDFSRHSPPASAMGF